MSDVPISLLECYKLQETMKQVRTLADMGINGPDCQVRIIRYTQQGPVPVHCLKFSGHEGDHETYFVGPSGNHWEIDPWQ